MPALAAFVLALLAALGGLLWRRRKLPARAVIITPGQSTAITANGAVRSAQTAELSLSPARLDQLWTPANLENLARTYWRFLSRVTLGLVRVVYGDGERRVVFIARPLTLLRFDSPEYLLEAEHGQVRWRIRDGLLVARAGRGSGFLALDVNREQTLKAAKLRIEVEVANFYPAIAAEFSMPAYMATQAFVHVLVTHAFLRSLAKLELAESKVGALSNLAPVEAPPPPHAVARGNGARGTPAPPQP